MPTGKYSFADIDQARPEQDHSVFDPEPTAIQRVIGGVNDLSRGIQKGATSTMGHVNSLVSKIPGVGPWLASPVHGDASPEEMTRSLIESGKANNTGERIGKAVEQIGEFFLPGPAEASLIDKAAPVAGRALPFVKAAVRGIGAGAVNKAQGGDFTSGAMMGAGGEGMSQLIKRAAVPLAETSLRVRGADRAYGAQPGKAILEETTGIRPATVARAATKRLDELTAEKNSLAQRSNNMVDLQPARNTAASAKVEAVSRNNKKTGKDVDELYDQLHTEYGSGNSIPSVVTAPRAVDLQRGVADLRDFSPTARSTFSDKATGRAYHEIGEGIDKAVPEIAPLNKRTSSLIPVAKRASAVDLSASLPQRISGRLSAHTGALASGAFGGYQGYQHGGLPGAVVGGAAGLLIPEILSSPEFQMAAARSANSKAIPKIIRGASGSAMQWKRSKDDE